MFVVQLTTKHVRILEKVSPRLGIEDASAYCSHIFHNSIIIVMFIIAWWNIVASHHDPWQPLWTTTWTEDSSICTDVVCPPCLRVDQLLYNSMIYLIPPSHSCRLYQRSINLTGPFKREIQSTVNSQQSQLRRWNKCDKPPPVVVKVR